MKKLLIIIGLLFSVTIQAQYTTVLADHDSLFSNKYYRFKIIDNNSPWMIEVRVHSAREDTIDAVINLNTRSSGYFMLFSSNTDTVTSAIQNIQFSGSYLPGTWVELEMDLNKVDTMVVSAWYTRK